MKIFWLLILCGFMSLCVAPTRSYGESPMLTTLSISDRATPRSERPWSIVLFGLGALGIMIRKDTGTLAQKFVTRAGAAAGDYKDGVTNAGAAWAAGAGAGEGNWEAGVQAATANKMYQKGIARVGPTKYVNNAVNLGSQRYGPGVANAKDAWAKGVQKYLDVLKGLSLPPKGARRSPQNQARAAAVATALAAAKVAS